MADRRAAAGLIPQTFECRPTAPGLTAGALPDELMLNWAGFPRDARAFIYIPEFEADAILTMAGRLYQGRPFTRVDNHTIACAAGGLTYLPIPAGPLPGPNFAALLTIEMPPGLTQGRGYRLTATQLSTVEPPEDIVARAVARRTPIRRAVGGFRLNITIKSKRTLLTSTERSLALFRWIVGTLESLDRWRPVIERLVGELAQRVDALGGDSSRIGASRTGALPGEGEGAPHPASEREWTGKIERLGFDRFGDFESFVLETDAGERRTFVSRESGIAELAGFVWRARLRVTVVADARAPHVPARMSVHPPARFPLRE